MHRVLRQPRQRFGLRRRFQDGAHVGRDLAAFDAGHALEIGARGVRQAERKVECAKAREAAGQMADGVVLDRHRAVATAVGDFKGIGLEHLFASLDAHAHRLASGVENAARTFVQGEVGVDQRAVVFQQVFDAVEWRRDDFLVAGGGQHDVALRPIAFAFVADQVVEEHRHHRLVVGGAARVKVAALLDQLERVAGPVFAPGFDHIEMAEQQNRLLRTIAAQARDQVALFRRARRHDDLDVGRRNAAGDQPLLHRLGRHRATAGRIGGVDFDQFLVKLAQLRLRGGRHLRPGMGGEQAEDAGNGERVAQEDAGCRKHGGAIRKCHAGKHTRGPPHRRRPGVEFHSRPGRRAIGRQSMAGQGLAALRCARAVRADCRSSCQA